MKQETAESTIPDPSFSARIRSCRFPIAQFEMSAGKRWQETGTEFVMQLACEDIDTPAYGLLSIQVCIHL
ncbi:hypothetical protein N7486_007385 [Penicillium sp. IBT 16267x]|nr:hypothetical protein N7486_007385 [Penicillium sp. IBT 16267x]